MSNKSIFLASGSPRRSQLLSQLGYQFIQVLSNIEEIQKTGESAKAYVQRLAKEKAMAAYHQVRKDGLYLGADTLISYEDDVFEKPKDKLDHHSMLMLLSDNTHQVMTSVAVTDGKEIRSIFVVTDVDFKKLTSQEITSYWETQEPLDKAGGYAIQGIGGNFVRSIRGSYSGVVGLPLVETKQLLDSFVS